tara:strand:- start:136 stop:669 length:534 start_codon:yes stop_codon:yes gene_type:complete
MAKQIYDWGKVDYGDIISFRYPSKEGSNLNTVLVLQPSFTIPDKSGVVKSYLAGLKLEERGSIPTVTNKTLLLQVLQQIGDIQLVSYEKEIYKIEITNPSAIGAKLIYEKIKSDIKPLGIYRTYNLNTAKRGQVFLQSISLPTAFKESLRPEEPEIEEPEIEEPEVEETEVEETDEN